MKKKSMKKKQIHQVKVSGNKPREGKTYGQSMIRHTAPEMSHSARQADMQAGMKKHNIACY